MDDQNERVENAEEETVERFELLHELERWLEGPVRMLGLVWLVLLVVEFVRGLGPILNAMVYIIWGIFIIDFAIRFIIAPQKIQYIRKNWLTLISLALPALRIFTLFRFVRFIRFGRLLRGVNLVKLLGSLNRGMKVLRTYLGRRKFGFVIALTFAVTMAGGAGMYALENQNVMQDGFTSFADALWWTAMIMTTLGSGYWPQSAEGRLLTLLLSVYSLSVFGYVTATIATFLIGQEASSRATNVASDETIRDLTRQLEQLRTSLDQTQSSSSGE